MRWYLALTGLYLVVFALCALSGPGRIDIVDGQTAQAHARLRELLDKYPKDVNGLLLEGMLLLGEKSRDAIR